MLLGQVLLWHKMSYLQLVSVWQYWRIFYVYQQRIQPLYQYRNNAIGDS